MKIGHLNRLKKTEPKSGLFWCFNCDRGVVAIGQKCKTCGARFKSKHRRV